MLHSKDTASRQSDHQSKSNANAISHGAVSLPAVAIVEQKDESEEETGPLQLKNGRAKSMGNTSPDPGSPTIAQSNAVSNNSAATVPFKAEPAIDNKNIPSDSPDALTQFKKDDDADPTKAISAIKAFKLVQNMKVNYNSDNPSQLKAHAFEQSNAICAEGVVQRTTIAYLGNRPRNLAGLSILEAEKLRNHLMQQKNGSSSSSSSSSSSTSSSNSSSKEPLFTIHYGENEEPADLLKQVEAKIKAGKPATGKFNVRARGAEADGIVFSEDSHVIGLALNLGLFAAAYDKKEFAKTQFSEIGTIWKLILDQAIPMKGGQMSRTCFYGTTEMEARGGRANAAAASANKGLIEPPSNVTHKLKPLFLSKQCTRGDETKTREAAMGGQSAKNYAEAAGFKNAEDATWEWLHLIGSSLGGNNERGNLVAGTYDANTLMIPMEQQIVEYSKKATVNAGHPMTIEAEAGLWRNKDGKLTWVADTITLSISHKGNKVFWLGPIQALRIGFVTKMEYDFFAYIFGQMAKNAP